MSPPQLGTPDIPILTPARTMLGRPSLSSNEAAGSPAHFAGANADEPVRIKVTGKVKAVKSTGCEDFVKVG